MARYTIRPSAWRDLNREADHLEEHAGVATALRFLDAGLKTFSDLAVMPEMGPACEFRQPALAQLRRWPITGFQNWSIFYQPAADGIEVVHIYHGARDLYSVLGG